MTLRLLATLLAAAAFTASSLFAQDADTEGFVSLYNGKDLSGWVPCNVAADTFQAKDGYIMTTGIPTGVMRTERMYENFIIELEWRHLKEAGNAGLFIWGESIPAPGVPFSRGIEVQILDPGYEKNKGAKEWFTSHGDIFPIWGATMTAVDPVAKGGKRSFPREDRVKPSPEWNHYRVVCNNGEIRLSVNGKEVTVGKDCWPRKGYICLESEGSEAHFRNIRIKELPSTGATPEQTAREFAGFKQLFDGKTLKGWATPDDLDKWWSAQGAFFQVKGGKQGHGKDLWTEKSYKDFQLIVDWKMIKKPEPKKLVLIAADGKDAVNADGSKQTVEVMDTGDSGIFLRGAKKAQINIFCRPSGSGEVHGFRVAKETPEDQRKLYVPKEKADNKPGTWNRFVITLQKGKLSVELNEKLVIDQAPVPGLPEKGPIGLQHHGDEMQFGNIFIKEL